MKILLLGGSGQVGYELARCLPVLGEVVIAGRETGDLRCDLSNPASMSALIDATEPDVVVNAAAYTAVDRAESEASLATLVNAESPRTLAVAAARREALLVHYSTDYVFAGDGDRPYEEEDRVAPNSVYGVSKAAGEHAIRSADVDHLIFRTAWVYAARGSNFLLSILGRAAKGDPLRIVNDQRGSPTWARFLAGATCHAVAAAMGDRSEYSGTYHLAANGSTTWYDYAAYFLDEAQRLGLIAKVPEIAPVDSDAFPTPAKRPAWSVLNNRKFETTFGLRVPHWREGVDACLADIASGRR